MQFLRGSLKGGQLQGFRENFASAAFLARVNGQSPLMNSNSHNFDRIDFDYSLGLGTFAFGPGSTRGEQGCDFELLGNRFSFLPQQLSELYRTQHFADSLPSHVCIFFSVLLRREH